MTLQEVFYITAIISFGVATLLLASLVVLVFFIMKKLGRLMDNIDQRVERVGEIVDNPGLALVDLGVTVLTTSVTRVKKLFNGK